MKSLIFLLEFEKSTGGMMQSALSLIYGLSERGYSIIIICPPNSEIRRKCFNEHVQVLSTACSWYTSKDKPLKFLKTSFAIYKLIQHDISNSILISNDLGASFLISLFPCKHKEVFVCRGGRFTGFAGKVIKYKIKKRIYWTVATSKFQKDFIIKQCGMSNRLSVIHNGLKEPEIQYDRPQLTRENLKISVVGYIAPGKNQFEGVKLIKRLRDNGINAMLNIYGTVECQVDEVYNNKLQRLIDELNVRDCVHFKGFASQDEIYNNTDILISFSFAEGFGRTLVEAMFRRRPVIAYRGAGGPIDITDNGNVGHLVDNNCAEDYYNVINRILDNPESEMEQIEKAYDYAVSHFTEDVMVDNYDRLFQSL